MRVYKLYNPSNVVVGMVGFDGRQLIAFSSATDSSEVSVLSEYVNSISTDLGSGLRFVVADSEWYFLPSSDNVKGDARIRSYLDRATFSRSRKKVTQLERMYSGTAKNINNQYRSLLRSIGKLEKKFGDDFQDFKFGINIGGAQILSSDLEPQIDIQKTLGPSIYNADSSLVSSLVFHPFDLFYARLVAALYPSFYDKAISLSSSSIRNFDINGDSDLLFSVSKGLGPSIYNKDSNLVTVDPSDPVYISTVRDQFLISFLGLADDPAILDPIIAIAVSLGVVDVLTFHYSIVVAAGKEQLVKDTF